MKQLILITGIVLGFASAKAQVADVQVNSCTNDTTSIYKVLSKGKALLIASKGTDCSACRNRAGGLQQWAAANVGEVEVWGAMTKIYSSNNPSCSEVANWITTYNWTAIFTYVDDQKMWLDQGTPRYYVYDPSDSSLAYNGFSESDAKNTALAVSLNPLSVSSSKQRLKPTLAYEKNNWKLVNLAPGNYVITIVDLTGQLVKTKKEVLTGSQISIDKSDLQHGIYLIRIENKAGEVRVIKAVSS